MWMIATRFAVYVWMENGKRTTKLYFALVFICICRGCVFFTHSFIVATCITGCAIGVHQLCYGVPTIPTDDWWCRVCEKRLTNKSTTKVKCILCNVWFMFIAYTINNLVDVLKRFVGRALEVLWSQQTIDAGLI